MKFHCAYDKLVPPSSLTPHPKNPNRHSKEQVKRLAKIILAQGWRKPIVVSKRSGFITSGHGRLLAAQSMSSKKVPVNFQGYESEAQEYQDLIADNAIAQWADLDLSSINTDIGDLGPDFDLDLLGIEGFTVDVADKTPPADLYSKKIRTPIYEPKGDRPSVAELFDRTKTKKLLLEVESMDAPEDVKRFLCLAAERHTVFNYERIAEFYAHAPKETQLLMESSALVIIDFKKAIENGFVVLTQEIAEAYPHD